MDSPEKLLCRMAEVLNRPLGTEVLELIRERDAEWRELMGAAANGGASAYCDFDVDAFSMRHQWCDRTATNWTKTYRGYLSRCDEHRPKGGG